MSTTGYANAPFKNLRAVFAIFCMAIFFGFGSGAIAKYSLVYHCTAMGYAPPEVIASSKYARLTP
ncbi:MAG: hypothetical protein KME55_14540 [Nostoc indistinguendum CM1-VF10]|jgi:hypothetical protein|nr:hypothetical protein [Nostoc indistinguendum CM1-VF10]